MSGKVLGAMNAMFIALILEKNDPKTFNDYKPVSLCNCVYKIIPKILANKIKGVLSKVIFKEKIRFLNNRQIYDVVATNH
jgi:hypothetical protein